MRNYIVFSGILVAVLLGTSCKKSPVLETDFVPRMNKCFVEKISVNNVTVSASFQTLDPSFVEDCGFFWGEKNSNTLKAIHLGKITEKNFITNIKTKTNPNTEYVVKAWVRSGSKYFYTDPTYFQGALVVKPKLVSVNKNSVLWGDTIVMNVENFPDDATPADIKVLIDGNEAQVIQCDTSKVSVQVPFSYKTGTLAISASVNQQSFSNTLQIKSALPQIDNVYPLSAAINGTVSIQGTFNVDYKNRILPVVDAQTRYTITSYSDNEIIIKVPESAACSYYFDVKFMILQSALSAPFIMFPTNYSIQHVGNWSIMSNMTYSFTTKSVYLDGEAYVFEQNNSGGASWFARYTPATNQWTNLANFPGQSSTNHNAMICEGKIYAGFWPGYSSQSNFYRYDIQTNTWIPLKALSKSGWNKVAAFTNQGKIYAFVMGESKLGMYDPATNTWTYKAFEVPELIDNFRAFNYNGKFYFYKGSYNTDYLYRFDESEGVLSVVKIDNLDQMTSAFFEYGGRFYCLGYDNQIYELDMLQKKLSVVPGWCNYLISGLYGSVSSVFSTESKVYFSLAQNTWFVLSPGSK